MGILSILAPIFGSILEKCFPGDDDNIKLAKLELEKRQIEIEGALQAAVIQQSTAQVAVDQNEANSSSFFVSGWRPAVGWLGVFGLAWAVGFQPMISWLMLLCHLPALPTLDTNVLTTLLMGLLGLGGLRTVEKFKGVDNFEG